MLQKSPESIDLTSSTSSYHHQHDTCHIKLALHRTRMRHPRSRAIMIMIQIPAESPQCTRRKRILLSNFLAPRGLVMCAPHIPHTSVHVSTSPRPPAISCFFRSGDKLSNRLINPFQSSTLSKNRASRSKDRRRRLLYHPSIFSK